MKRRDVVKQIGLGGLACALPAFPALAQSSDKTLWIGQSAALSGPASALGQQFQLGAKLYFDQVNARGGVAGRQIALRSLDDGYEPDRCTANTRTLIDEGVFALFGYIGTPTSLAALPLATAAKVPFIAPFTGAEPLRDPFNRYAFHVRASYFDETDRIVRQMVGVGIRHIGVLYQNDSYGKAGLEGVTRALKVHNLQPVGLGTFERNTVDVAAAVKALLPAKPTAIVQIGAYRPCAAFIREARIAGYGGTFYNVSFVGTQVLAKELGAEAQGVVVSQVMPFPFHASKPVTSEYLAAGAALVGSPFEPNYSSIEGYIGAKVLVEGIRRASGRLTRESLVGGLESMQDVNLGGFFVDFSPTKHTGSKFVEMTILTDEGKVRR